MKLWDSMIAMVVMLLTAIFLFTSCAGMQVKSDVAKTDFDLAMELATEGVPNVSLKTNEWICEYELNGPPVSITFAFDLETGHFYFVRYDLKTTMVLEYYPNDKSFRGRAYYQGMCVYDDVVSDEDAMSWLKESIFEPLHKSGKFNKESNIAKKTGIPI
jgi:hypothetical protein